MADLFQLILANPLLLIILIGGLISVFSRMAQSSQQQQGNEEGQGQAENQQQRQRPVQMEPRRQSGSEIKWEDYFPAESAPPVQQGSRTSETEDSSVSANVQKQQELYERHKKAKAKAKELQDSLEIGAIADLGGVTESNRDDTKKDGLDMNFNQLSGKEAMRAVVWSEILGPPKGRVSPGNYRSNRR